MERNFLLMFALEIQSVFRLPYKKRKTALEELLSRHHREVADAVSKNPVRFLKLIIPLDLDCLKIIFEEFKFNRFFNL